MFKTGDVVEAKPGTGGNFTLQIINVSTITIGSLPYHIYEYKHLDGTEMAFMIPHEWLWKNARKRAPKRSVKHYFEGT